MIKQIIGANALIHIIKTTNPIKLGILQAKVIDKILDGILKEKRSEVVQKVAVPWIRKFCRAFCSELLRDQK